MSQEVGNRHVTVGAPDQDHVRIGVLGRMHPHADDYWDGNWLMTPVEVVAGAFRGSVSATLRAEELRSFRDAIKRLDDSLQGEAVLSSMEDWLNLRISIDPLGHLEVSGQVSDRPGVGNQLTFTIDGLDQADLHQIVDALDEILASFPVIGSP